MVRTLKTGSWTARLAFSPDGGRLAVGHVSGLTVFDTTTWEIVHERTRSPTRIDTWVSSVAYSPDGKRIATGRFKGSIQVWDAASGAEVAALPVNGRTTTALILDDGRHLIACGGGNDAVVWDLISGKAVRQFRGHDGRVNGTALSPDENRLVTGSDDGTVKVWNTTTGDEILTLAGHTGPVWGVAWSRDGRRVTSASADGTVRVWEAGPVKKPPTKPAVGQK